MNNYTEKEQDDKEKKTENKRFEYIIQIVICSITCIWLIEEGIRNHYSIIGTIWFTILIPLTFYIYNKLGIDVGVNFQKMLVGAIFIPLLLMSYLIYLVINLLGLDLLKWLF